MRVSLAAKLPPSTCPPILRGTRSHRGQGQRHGRRCESPVAPVRRRLALTFSPLLSPGIPLASCDARARDQLRADWSAIQEATHTRVSRHQRVHSAGAAWTLWSAFCGSLSVDPAASHPIPYLSSKSSPNAYGPAPSHPAVDQYAFGRWRRPSVLWARRTPGWGPPDPRLNTHGTLDFCLTALYQSWSKADEPPSRVKPLPLTLLTQVVTLASQEATQESQAASDCLILGFFFLLRPGEYLSRPVSDTDTLFCLDNLTPWVGSRILHTGPCPLPPPRPSSGDLRHIDLYQSKERRPQ
ncbi:hypothetical protein MHU86_7456 [Fragilaria crotonensis]|nr:hypothetical protein MHU86_7456 [Fragilaria crotonensis]